MFLLLLVLLVIGDDLRPGAADGEFFAAAAADCCCCKGNVGKTEAGGWPDFELDEALGLPLLAMAPAAALLFETRFWGDPAAIAAAVTEDGLLLGLLDGVTPNDICVW